jgi:DNA-binding MarR family transcriptional regulator
MLHQAVADRLGLNPTDHKCVDLLCMHGPKTAGELAELTGLTTGAITIVIDRLEAAGFVRREDDPSDRRRVVIRIESSCPQKIGRMFESLRQSMTELTTRYTDRELATIIDFMTRSREIAHEETIKLRKGRGTGKGK